MFFFFRWSARDRGVHTHTPPKFLIGRYVQIAGIDSLSP